MSPRLKGLAIFVCFMLVLVSSYPLSLIAEWLAFVPFTLFMLGVSALALWSVRSAPTATSMDLSPLPLYRLTMSLFSITALAFAALTAAIGLLLRFAPHTRSALHTHRLEVQGGTFYVTGGQAVAYSSIEIALVATFAVTFVLMGVWNYANRAARRAQPR